MSAESGRPSNAVEDQLLSRRLLGIGGVGAFLVLVIALEWTTLLKLAAGCQPRPKGRCP